MTEWMSLQQQLGETPVKHVGQDAVFILPYCKRSDKKFHYSKDKKMVRINPLHTIGIYIIS
jgi:hypothetical protein